MLFRAKAIADVEKSFPNFMSEELKTFIIFLIGLFSAYFGSFSSGGVSVLGVGLLTMLGISPQMATITFKIGKIGDVL